jgi:3-hydroxyisobutyrate dehydrogenase
VHSTTPGSRGSIAVLGAGAMGAPIARNLMRAGFDVWVWNRTPARAEAVVADGARWAATPAAAAAAADMVITVLSDGAAVHEVMTGADGALPVLAADTVWLQMSTIGVEWTERLAELAARRDVAFVDAPVSGGAEPARKGELLILAAGPREVRPMIEPVFDALARQTLWLRRTGDGSRLQLALNNWLAVLVEGMVEAIELSRALDLDPRLFVDTITGGPLGPAYAVAAGNAMLLQDFAPGFPLRHAAKDATLAYEAAREHGVELALTSALLRQWRAVVALGHGDEDVASAVTAREVRGGYGKLGRRGAGQPQVGGQVQGDAGLGATERGSLSGTGIQHAG